LTKTKSSLVTWLSIITLVAQNVCLLSAHVHEGVNCIAGRNKVEAGHRLVWSMPCQTCSKHCFNSQHLFT